MTKRTPVFPEVRERAVRMLQEHQGEHGARHAAIRPIASKIGCSGGNPARLDRGSSESPRAGATTDERARS